MPHAATHSAPPLFTALSDDDPAANDNLDLFGPAILRAARRLRILEELTNIGMELTRTLQRRVLAEDEAATVSAATNGDIAVSAKLPASKSSCVDPAGAFAKISRAIRETMTMEIRAEEALRALNAGESLARGTSRKTARDKVEDRDASVVDRAALTETEHRDPREAIEEGHTEDCVYLGVEDRRLDETVERLCIDLGLPPDWTRRVGKDE